MARDPEALAHQEWIGYVQPVGLVVSIPALLAAQAQINRNIIPDHQRFLACLPRHKDDEIIPELRDFPEFTRIVLNWRASDLEAVVPGDDKYASLEVVLPEYHETLRPTHVVREYEPKNPAHPWMMLVQSLPSGSALDDVATHDNRNWEASPHAKFERLLRETRVPIGLLINNTQIRLVYAPRGETSGYATFNVSEMAQVAGRPVFAALHMLLCEERLFALGEKQRLPAILAESRKYQNVVSSQLAEQVLAALYELVRGFQAADDQSKGELLREVLAENPNHVYQGLLTVLMRLVFVLFAEDRGLLSSDPTFANFYSITGLFERLRADDGRFPDTMNQRYGAWAQLLTLFRLIYEGASHGEFKIPPRHGYLFDPDRYNFLEGRKWKSPRQPDEVARVPRVADGVIFRVLNNLLILHGERLSYRTLDVEQIGSVYETMMGFDLEVAQGRSIAIKPKKSHGAPTTINLEALLAVKCADRGKWLKRMSEQELTGQLLEALKTANNVDGLLAALDKKIAKSVTPNVVSKGAMILQPSDERRRSGSHYTPRSLTEPIVRTTLRPILEQLGPQPKPEQILDLRVCDPAMGSGAFLVEACRQLGDELVKAWHFHKAVPTLPPDEDELLHARRLIAQRCLYGVDRNPMAVDLSKLSLWLATLAKDHPFTFLDHSLRAGDSLVGLTREQIAGFHWKPDQQMEFLSESLKRQIDRATEFRRRILASRDDVPYVDLQQNLAVADEALDRIRRVGDLVIAAFFAADKDRGREIKRNEYLQLISEAQGQQVRGEHLHRWLGIVQGLRTSSHPMSPFHWQIEFPEVFALYTTRKPFGGFDAIVGNPPFMGGSKISTNLGTYFLDWLLTVHPGSHGNGDLVAHFFRRGFDLITANGCCGLIATKTIGQGDTRTTGLRWICEHGATIYAARKRLRWPGQAAVVVSVVWLSKGTLSPPFELDGRSASIITAFLFHAGGHENPLVLQSNRGVSFLGSKIYGQGFVFDDTDSEATPLAEMRRLIAKDGRNSERIFPYIGGEEVNDDPFQTHHRYVINFGVLSEQEARRWPDLMEIVEAKVKPVRLRQKREVRAKYWWRFGEPTPALYGAVEALERTLAISYHTECFAFSLLPASCVFSHALIIIATESIAFFSVLQSRQHETWARFLGSSIGDTLRYTPSDCFETFPFPEHLAANTMIESAGRQYYDFRTSLLVKNNEGLTKTYNRFHDPEERSPDILKLRELHFVMDRAVLEAYGWHDLAQNVNCEFLLDYEDDEEDEEQRSTGRGRKKPWRYRWPDDFRDEVLARLLELNKQRAEQERLLGSGAQKKRSARCPRKASKQVPKTANTLFPGID